MAQQCLSQVYKYTLKRNKNICPYKTYTQMFIEVPHTITMSRIQENNTENNKCW